MTLQESAVHATKRSTDELLHWFNKMPEEMTTWRANEHVRTAVEVVAECVAVCENWTDWIRHGAITESVSALDLKNRMASIETREHAIEQLKSSVDNFNEMVLELTDENLETEIISVDGTQKVAIWILHVAGHNLYHAGQIAYIQTLKGDSSY